METNNTDNLGVTAAMPKHDTRTYRMVQTVSEERGEQASKYDWWQASISIQGMGKPFWVDINNDKYRVGEWHEETDIDAFLNWMAQKLPMSDRVYRKGNNSYERACAFVCGDSTECLVQWGGVNLDINITSTGGKSPLIHSLITSRFPVGRISRMDSAIDSLSGTSAFRAAAKWLESRADQAGVNYRWIRNSDESIGDTLYVGSPTSRVMIRLYEKGKQMGYRPSEWWRAEVQLKPSSRDKETAYEYSPGMVWGASRITRDFMQYLTGESLQASSFQAPKIDKDLDTKAAYLIKQYHNTIRDLLQDSGSANALILRFDRIAESMGLPRLSEPESGERL